MNLEIDSEYLVLASELIEIKSKLLLPNEKVEDEEEEIDPRQELVERLLEYKKFKYISDELKDKQFDAEKILYKANTIPPELKDIGMLASLDPVALDQACVDLIYKSNDKGKTSLIKRMEEKHAIHILETGEELGIGSRKYDLIELDEVVCC